MVGERDIMPICPECKGKKGYDLQISEYWEELLQYEWHICQTCEGTGKVCALELAIYKARGGPAPPTIHGFA